MTAAGGAGGFGQSGRSDTKSIVLGDEHAVFVESLVSVLTSHGFRVPAVARNLAGTIEAIRHQQPDVGLLARHFSDGDGISAISRINAVSPATRIVILAADRDAEAMRQAVRLGAGARAGAGHRRRSGARCSHDKYGTIRCFRGTPAGRSPDRSRTRMPCSACRRPRHRGHDASARRVDYHRTKSRAGAADQTRSALPARGRHLRGAL